MALPLLLAATGLKVAGGLLGRREADKNAEAVANARNSALMSYLKRQGDLADEARGYFTTRMADYAPGVQDKALATAQDSRSAALTGNLTAPSDGSEIAVSRSAPPIVRGEIAKRMLDAFNTSTERAKAMGKLGGYGDTWLNNTFGLADTSRRIGTVNNFSQAEAAMLGNQLDLAEAAAPRSSSIWPGILSAGGDLLALGAGFFGGGAPDLSKPLPGSRPLGQGGFASPAQRA